MKRNNEEHRIQCGIIDWYDLRYGDGMLLAIPNGGARDARTGAMLKREGVRAGVWDLFLAKPNLWRGHTLSNGLWIEVKSPKRRNHKLGGLTNEQFSFMTCALENGYQCEVVYTTQEGIDVISRYLTS
jgi:hypothetical protein